MKRLWIYVLLSIVGTCAAVTPAIAAWDADTSSNYFGRGGQPSQSGPKPTPTGTARPITPPGPPSSVAPPSATPTPPSTVTPPSSGTPTANPSAGKTGKFCRGALSRRAGRTCSYYRTGRLLKVCNAKRSRTVCTHYANGRAVQRCTKRSGKKTICKKIRAGAMHGLPSGSGAWGRGAPARVPAGLINHGYTNPLIPAVGALWNDGRQNCSGTLIARGVVLTAGHCLYENRLMSTAPTGYFRGRLTFAPGQTWIEGYDLQDPRYGEWLAKDWWVPQGWADGQDGLDWGLVELYPNANGQYPGDFTGTFTAQVNIRYNIGAHVYLTGYPASGQFASLHRGLGQYFCNTTWDGYTMQHTANVMLSYPCLMTGGASGGAVFVELADGRWVIGGVNNQAFPDKFNPSWGHTAYFDDRLAQFYTGIFGTATTGFSLESGETRAAMS